MAHFEFVTLWRLKAPLAPVWACIYDHERWPSWWKGVEKVDVIRPGGPDSVGTLTRQVWKSALPYRLRFDIEITKVEPMRVMEVAAKGELQGIGIMSFAEEHEEVVVRFDWRVETTRPWMNLLAPLAGRLFRWNHGVIMDWGAECIAKRLGAKLVATVER